MFVFDLFNPMRARIRFSGMCLRSSGKLGFNFTSFSSIGSDTVLIILGSTSYRGDRPLLAAFSFSDSSNFLPFLIAFYRFFIFSIIFLAKLRVFDEANFWTVGLICFLLKIVPFTVAFALKLIFFFGFFLPLNSVSYAL